MRLSKLFIDAVHAGGKKSEAAYNVAMKDMKKQDAVAFAERAKKMAKYLPNSWDEAFKAQFFYTTTGKKLLVELEKAGPQALSMFSQKLANLKASDDAIQGGSTGGVDKDDAKKPKPKDKRTPSQIARARMIQRQKKISNGK